MAAHHQPSPPSALQLHHGPAGGPPPQGMAGPQQQWAVRPSSQMTLVNEATWLQIGERVICSISPIL